MRYKKKHILDNYHYTKFKNYINDINSPHVVIFDIGTKACRIIIAPKSVPVASLDEWKNEMFFNASLYAKLGEHVNPVNNILKSNSSRLWAIIKFMQFFFNQLKECSFIHHEDIHAFGTEVFRWLSNQDEIIQLIEESTSIKFKVLSEEQESFFSLVALQYTTQFRSNENITIPDTKNLNSIFLIDQGGGSTEISYFIPKDPSSNDHKSVSKFGTISLKDIFFRLDSKGNTLDPLYSNYSIPQQIESLNNYIEKVLDEFNLPLVNNKNTNIIFYGMGSAIHNMYKYSNINSHNRVITIDTISSRIQNIAIQLNGNYKRISDLFNLIENDKISDNISKKLTLFYGLPVYAHILSRYNVNEIRLAGFGLRYGIYIYLYASMRDHIASDQIEGIPVMYKQNNDPQLPPKVFISYSHDSEKHEKWVQDLADKLIASGVDAKLDIYDMGLGENLNFWMEKNENEADFILPIFSENYSIKANERKGGVGFEYGLIMQSLNDNITNNKRIIPIIKLYNSQKDYDTIPKFIRQFLHLDFSNEEEFDMKFDKLLRKIHNERKHIRPSLGPKPKFD